MKIYLTKQDAIFGLHQNGYNYDFHISGNDLLWVQKKILVRAGDFFITECYHFIEGSQKQNGIIILGIIAPCHSAKGILIRHYTSNVLKIPPVILKKLKDMLTYSEFKIPKTLVSC
ncbi:hypothetical protein [Ferruginibacter profundus]